MQQLCNITPFNFSMYLFDVVIFNDCKKKLCILASSPRCDFLLINWIELNWITWYHGTTYLLIVHMISWHNLSIRLVVPAINAVHQARLQGSITAQMKILFAQKKEALSDVMKEVESVALTTDCWMARNQEGYMIKRNSQKECELKPFHNLSIQCIFNYIRWLLKEMFTISIFCTGNVVTFFSLVTVSGGNGQLGKFKAERERQR